MRTKLLMEADGTIIGGDELLVGEENFSTLGFNQLTLEFFDDIIIEPNGSKAADPASVVNSGLSGVLTLAIYSSEYTPYPAALPNNGQIIDVATTSMTPQFVGVIARLLAASSTVAGCNYIRILIDRWGE